MIGSNQISWMAVPGIKIDQSDIIWTPHVLIFTIEKEFNIPGMLFFKSRSPKYSFPRFLFSFIMINKFKLCPDILFKVYGIRHDLVWHGCKAIQNTLDTKSPKHYYIRCTKIIQKIKKWDISEIIVKLESIPVTTASHAAIRKNILEQSMAVAQSTRTSSANDAMVPEELKLQQQQ